MVFKSRDQTLDRGDVSEQGVAGVVLDPLAEVGVGVLVPVRVRFRQRVVHLECGRERGQRQENQGKDNCDRRSGNPVRGTG